MILDIDIGNSRVKWRAVGTDGVIRHGHCARDTADWAGALPQQGMTRVRVANVGGSAAAEQLTSWAQARWGLAPEYVRAVRTLAGVTNGYREPEQLGVDRWLALLAAWRELHGGAVVVSAGTALTVDILGTNGQHVGGYIVPGLYLMRDALISGTSGVRPAVATVASLAPGHSTTEAVLHGCMAMAAALIESARRDLATPVVLSGGDADVLAPWLAGPVLLRPELVLDGLGIALP